jgi:hypothetical protein
MIIRKIVRNIIAIGVVSLVLAVSTVAFSQEATISLHENTADLELSGETKKKEIDTKSIKKADERALTLARQAIKWTDTLPGKKTKAVMMDNELNNLIERKQHLLSVMQKLKIGLMRKKAKHARNPELLEVSVKQYSQNIMEMEDELAEIEKRLPVEKSRLARVTIEVEAEELRRGIEDTKGKTNEYEVEFEEAKQERWEIAMRVLNHRF